MKYTLCLWLALCGVSSLAWGASTIDSVKPAPGSVSIGSDQVTYYAVAGDTLISIAQEQTGNPNNWAELGKFNHIGNDRRIPIGTGIVIPANLLRDEPSEASVSAFSGQVSLIPLNATAQQVGLGSKIGEGGQVITGANSFITFALSDGSHISLPSNSRVKLSILRMARYTHSPRTEITLIEGNVESRVTPLVSNKGRFEVHSPLSTAGVRGTHFRVAKLDDAIANEVLDGVVAVGSVTKPATLALAAGNGNIISVKSVGQALALLPAPTLVADTRLQQRPIIQFGLNAVAHATSYHAQIALDRDAQNVIAETHATTPTIKLDGPVDGDYFLRVTAIDAAGLEGLPNLIPFKLKARPVPPFSSKPQSKVRAEHVDFEWTEAPDVQFYHLQLSKEPDFHELLVDEARLSSFHFSSDKLAPGKYYWRIASVAMRNNQIDAGPFGDSQAFELLPPQQAAAVVDKGGNDLGLQWPAEPGQKFLLQVARDQAFSSLLLSRTSDLAEISIPRPDAGTYYVRVQTTDPDGYVAPFSAPQKFTVYSRWVTESGSELKSEGGTTRAGF